MTRLTHTIVGIVVILAVGAVVYSQSLRREGGVGATQTQTNANSTLSLDGGDSSSETENGSDDASPQNTKAVPQSAGSSSQKIYSLADVTRHAGASSCWSAINGNVYDLTSWIPQHPGGPEAILSLCGTDGSSRFNAQHGGSALQARILGGFKIGSLKHS